MKKPYEMQVLQTEGHISQAQLDLVENAMLKLRKMYGLNDSSVHNCYLALGNIIIMGRVSIDDFRQLLEPMPGIAQKFPILELIDLKDFIRAIKRGEVSTELFLDQLNDVLRPMVTEIEA